MSITLSVPPVIVQKVREWAEGAGISLNQYIRDCLESKVAEVRAARTGVQVWDLTTGPCEAIARSGMPLNWFKRDAAHNDDRGKQLIAQMFGEYFRAAWR